MFSVGDNIARFKAAVANESQGSTQLIAVSKRKDATLIVEAYEAGQRLFGENYVYELVEKAERMVEFTDIEWHFIGHLQSNKVKIITKVPNLTIQTVDSIKLINLLARHWAFDYPLKLFIQVSTSTESTKSGCDPSIVPDLVSAILAHENLSFVGLMTIGRAGDLSAFERLTEIAEGLCSSYEVPIKLSMGMSGDWREAIQHGADFVRIGTAIFGARQ